jgi:hypothetical protein
VQALRPIYVNLFNLIDHRRNSAVEIVRFASYRAFIRYTANGRKFPKACAKKDGIIKVLLKKM